ncbi:MAG: dockerin type I domain-containing protein, partial [Pirellulaceae bacterium]|nr:dockerin type I domain-containing protein [Pirellulaceae bacterium]
DKLLLVGTSGRDAVEVNAHDNDISVQLISNGNDRQQKNFSTSEVNELEIVLLAGDDFVQVTGQDPSQLEPFTLQIDGGRDDDWISAEAIRVKVTDMQGNNTITTGPENDEIHTGDGNDGIDAGQGENTIRDAGGVNRIITGQNDDSIYHANADDWIFVSDGVNQIWLNGVKTNWHNETTPEDVNRDQLITPLDALILINQLNSTGSYPLVGSADTVSFYYDTNNDDYLTPIDVLKVINYLNRPMAEGEDDSDHDLAAKPNGNQDQITDACFADWEPAKERSAEIADRLHNPRLLSQEKTSASNGSPLHGVDNELPKRLKQRTYRTW